MIVRKYGLLIIGIAVVFSFALLFWLSKFEIEKPISEKDVNEPIAPSAVHDENDLKSKTTFDKQVSNKVNASLNLDADDNALLRKRERLFDYSRSGNFDDTQSLLRSAYNEKIITENEYYGELAHMLSVSVKNPMEIISEIANSRNKYGFEVLVSTLNHNKMLADSMSEVERADVLNIVNQHKPVIDGYVWELGVSDVIWYENWIGSLKAFSTDEAFVNNLNDIIMNGITDPREAFGIYSVLYKDNYSGKISQTALNRFNFYISEYMKSYPDNKVAKYTVE